MGGLKYSFFVLLMLSFCACSVESKSVSKEKAFFDVAGLVAKEIALLKSEKPLFRKIQRINGKEETVQTKDIEWEKELEIILQADLNKAAFVKSYDKSENAGVLDYTLKNGENLAVKRQVVKTDSSTKELVISTLVSAHNYLYDSEKSSEIVFKNGRMISYKISGWQKLFIGEKSVFEIEGEVI